MKLTWFGKTVLRVYTGGEIIIVDADEAPEEIDRRELLAGADRLLSLHAPVFTVVDAGGWRLRPLRAAINDEPAVVDVLSVGPGTLLIAASGEPPLLLADTSELPHFGRWIDSAVVVLFGWRGVGHALSMARLDLPRPRLLALAGQDAELEDMLLNHRDELLELSLMILEPGTAVEI
jgi:hypothetical protein